MAMAVGRHSLFTFLMLWATTCLALVIDSRQLPELAQGGPPATDANPGLAGYLGIFFLGADPAIYFFLSDGNNATSIRPLNRGKPIVKPTQGTRGVRDPAIVPGGGAEAGRKWYIVGTDLDIGKTTWEASQRTGSRGILVWESEDLINWKEERLVIVEENTAGMAWAPEALWDAEKQQYLVTWSSKLYAPSDEQHTGPMGVTVIRCAYTSDFRTFTPPKTCLDYSPTSLIDLTILPLGGTKYLRFLKDETLKTVFVEVTNTGLSGEWTRPGGPTAVIAKGAEGPAAYLDNQVAGRVHLLLDYYNGDGYKPYESDTPESNGGWKESSEESWPIHLRHGSMLPIVQKQYDDLKSKWGWKDK